MPLESRIQRLGRSLARCGVSATPRVSLPFLYPRWFSPGAENPSVNATEARAEGSEAPERRGEPPEAHPKAQQPDVQANIRYTQNSVPRFANRNGQPSRPNLRKKKAEAARNLAWLRGWATRHKSQQDAQESEEAAHNLSRLRTWGGMPKMHGDITPSSFQLAPVAARRTISKAEKHNAHLDRLASDNSIRVCKGTWSYDWRIPLLELKQHTRLNTMKPGPHLDPTLVLVGTHPDFKDVPILEGAWTKGRFAAHVNHMTQSQVPRVMQRYVYSPDDPWAFQSKDAHVFKVRAALFSLFEDPSFHPFMTTSAFHKAIRFFYRQNMISSARKMINIMNELRVPILPSTFNIMLWGAAKRNDLHTFTYLLRLMIGRGIMPDTGTWVAFIAAVESKAVKLRIVSSMRELDLLQHTMVIQSVATQVLDMEIESHISGKHELLTLLSTMDSKFGNKWMSRNACSRICQKLGEAALMPQAMEMLGIMSDRGYLPNQVTLNIFLVHCLRAQDIEKALWFLRFFDEAYNVRLRENDYHVLFMLGWSTKSYNICRVVWRFACVEGTVSHRMQALVFKSLIRNTPEILKYHNQRWMKEAGKVIFGEAFSSDDQDSAIGANRTEAMSILARWSPAGEERTEALKLAKKLLTDDLTASWRYTHRGSIVDAFALAAQKDEQWLDASSKKRYTGDIGDLNWKIRNAQRTRFTSKRDARNVVPVDP